MNTHSASLRNQARRAARKAALQALYQWDLSAEVPAQIVAEFSDHREMEKIDSDFFAALVEGVARESAELDGYLAPHLDRAVESLDPIERCVMRLGAYELRHHLETPYKVVMNEAIELAKQFGAEQGHKYVNGVLDKIAAELRSAEVAAKKTS